MASPQELEEHEVNVAHLALEDGVEKVPQDDCPMYDDPFGSEEHGEVKYRTMNWCMGDAGEILLGSFGRELFGIGQLLLLIFLMASHILTFTILMNTLTDHGTCTIVFGVVGLVACFIGALPRTLAKVYWMSIACE
ncbi:unnamed protein product [Penicillium discolor]